jgi:hypothetical protein
MVTEEHIQSLVDRGLLRPKSQAGWRPTAGEAFPTEATGETVVFIVHIERGFGVPAGNFLRGLLQFYRIELVHLAPKSITIIATFIHLCEAFLGITSHFHLWRHFFELKKTGKGVVVGSVSFMLRRNMKSKYIDLALPDNTTGWKQGRKVSKVEMIARTKIIFGGRIRNKECPKALGIYCPADPVSLLPLAFSST